MMPKACCEVVQLEAVLYQAPGLFGRGRVPEHFEDLEQESYGIVTFVFIPHPLPTLGAR